MIDKEKELKVGKFYWVVPVNDPDCENEWERELQPARYAGNGHWNYIDNEASDWPVKYVEHYRNRKGEL